MLHIHDRFPKNWADIVVNAIRYTIYLIKMTSSVLMSIYYEVELISVCKRYQ